MSSLLQEAKTFLSLTPQDLSQQIILKKKQNVYFLLLNRKANTFTKEFLRCLNSKLELILSESPHGQNACLVTLSLNKIFSAGLDLKYMSSVPIQDARYFVLQAIATFAKFGTFPIPTIALVKGVAMAGGCMLAFSHDYIIVVQNGQFSTNQVDLQLPLPPGMMSAIRKKHVSHRSLRDMVLISKKFNEKEALQAGFIDQILPSKDGALQRVYEMGQELSKLGKDKLTFKKIKDQMYKDVLNNCYNRQNAVGVRAEMDQHMIYPKL